jgi:hypothetical protein
MKNPVLFYGAIVAAVVALALGVYYLVPGIYHPFTFSGLPTNSHYTHGIAFLALCVLLALVALVNRPKSAVR